MGELHLDIIIDRMKREFKVGCNVGKPRVSYRETISKPASADVIFRRQTGGHGQYARVEIEIEPAETGAGFVFEDKIRGGKIPKEYIRPTEAGIRDALSSGVIAGFPVIDVQVSLVDGDYHEVDSSDLAFRMAGSMALKEAVQKGDEDFFDALLEENPR